MIKRGFLPWNFLNFLTLLCIGWIRKIWSIIVVQEIQWIRSRLVWPQRRFDGKSKAFHRNRKSLPSAPARRFFTQDFDDDYSGLWWWQPQCYCQWTKKFSVNQRIFKCSQSPSCCFHFEIVARWGSFTEKQLLIE